jgi:hypothetical protein
MKPTGKYRLRLFRVVQPGAQSSGLDRLKENENGNYNA